jgi:hypothetical protein
MKRWIGASPLVLLTFTAGCAVRAPADAAGDPRRHVEPAGGFSFVPPEGWEVRPIPGLKFKAAFGPTSAGFTPNINVVDESFDGPLDAYVQGNIGAARRAFKQFRLLSQDEFNTSGDLRGARAVGENELNGMVLRQTYYFFAKGDTKFVVTCSAQADGGDKLDRVFEASMKTFRFDGQ